MRDGHTLKSAGLLQILLRAYASIRLLLRRLPADEPPLRPPLHRLRIPIEVDFSAKVRAFAV